MSDSTKARRVTQACDFCHRRGLKCKASNTASTARSAGSCLTCLEYGEPCTRLRQPKKRGTKRRFPLLSSHETPDESVMTSSASLHATTNPVSGLSSAFAGLGATKSQALCNRKIMTMLLDVYLDTIHPTFPLYCEREVWVGWRDGSFPANVSEYTSLICMCALSSQHVGNGAIFTEDEQSPDTANLAQDYLDEAVCLVATNSANMSLVNLIQSYGFLALLGAQNGTSQMVHNYLGLYHGVCAQSNIHDESRWPEGITECERELRRRLWWSMYRLEVHTGCVLGSLIRCSETQCDVGYPVGPHHPAFIPGRDGDFEDWFSGWNSTTDLYRLLEHAVLNFRIKHRKNRSILDSSIDTTAKSRYVGERLSQIQQQLLPQFGFASSPSADSGRNRCGFQACNILCTLHLARMITSLTGENTLETACQSAQALMGNLNAIPSEYIRATGSPLLQQLAGVGHMLVGLTKKNQAAPPIASLLVEVLRSIITFLGRFSEYSKLAADAQDKLAEDLTAFECNAQGGLGPATDGSSSAHDETSYLDAHYLELFEVDEENGQGLLNANLLKAFTWPFAPPSPQSHGP